MSATALRTLRDTLKRGAFDAVYYICGEDNYQKEDATRQLIAAIVDPVIRDFNLETRRAQELDGKSLDAALCALPVMAARRVVVVRDVSGLKKEARKVLDRYLEKPSQDVVLILVETPAGRTDKALAANATLLEFALLSAERIPNWIAHYASTEHQARVTAGAAEFLQSAVGNDLQQLVVELDKLASYAGGREIDEAAVTAIVGVRRGETMADFLDQVARRNSSKALEMMPRVLGQPKATGVSLVMALTTQTIALSWGRAKRDQGLPQGKMRDEYYTLLKECGSVFTGRSWASAVAAWTAGVEQWDAAALERALDALLDADLALKESKVSSEEQQLATLVLSMCVEGDHSIAA